MQYSQQQFLNPQLSPHPGQKPNSPAFLPPQDPRFLGVPGSAGLNQNINRIPIANPTIVSRPLSPMPGQRIASQSLTNQSSNNVIISQAGPTQVVQTNNLGPRGQTIINQTTQVQTPKPQSTSRIQYIPYEKTIVDYETRQVVTSMWVPIQKKCLNYYAIQNITQYIPKQVNDVRYEMVPEQQIQYKLQYVPIQKQIVHLPRSYQQQTNLYGVGTQQYNYTSQVAGYQIPSGVNLSSLGYGHSNLSSLGYGNSNLALIGRGNAAAYNSQTQIPGFVQLENRSGLIPRTNFVTTDGYVPTFMRPQPIPKLPPDFTLSNAALNSNLGGTNTASNVLGNQDLLQGIKNSMSNPNPLNNQDLFQGIRNSLSGANQNQNNTPSFLNDNAFMSGLAAGINRASYQNDNSINQSRQFIKPRQTRFTDNSMESPNNRW